MGFYKLLLSVNDTDVLREYVNDTLGSIITYDEQHHTNYLETLYQYLLCDGSIQKLPVPCSVTGTPSIIVSVY